jgi:FtsZ-interacting cell division protein ZipA
MQNNIEIYLIGLSVLIILITIFFIIKKISSNGDLKVKIEPVLDDLELNEELDDVNMELKSQSSFDFDQNNTKSNAVEDDQELAILNLISIDKSHFDIDQLFGFMSNCNANLNHGFFVLKDFKGRELFRVANALAPGTFEENSNTFAIVIATNLKNVEDPLQTFREMLSFAYSFSEKFHANICDGERAPITKQMISHIESKAQEITRLKQLSSFNQE